MIKTTEHELIMYQGKGWILFVSRDLKNWWTEKLLGFVRVCEKNTGYYENLCYWVPAYCSEGYVEPVHDKEKVAVIYNRPPTKEDAVTLSQGCIVGDCPSGCLEVEQEKLLW